MLNIHIVSFITIVLFGFSFPFICVYFDLPSGLTSMDQFHRAGSMTILVLIGAEIILFKIYQANRPGSVLLQGGNPNSDLWYEIGLFILMFFSMFGTLIWGYGDLIFEYYQR